MPWRPRYDKWFSNYKMQHEITLVLQQSRSRKFPKFTFWTVHSKRYKFVKKFKNVFNKYEIIFYLLVQRVCYVLFKMLLKVASSKFCFLVLKSKLSRKMLKIVKSFPLESGIIFNFVLRWSRYDQALPSYDVQHDILTAVKISFAFC